MVDGFEEFFDLELINEPYENNGDYLYDLSRLMDLKIYLYMEQFLKQTTADQGQMEWLKGLVISKEEMTQIMDTLTSEKVQQWGEGCLQKINAAQAYIDRRKQISIQRGIFLPILYLIVVFKLNAFEEHCLILSLLCHFHRKYEKIFGYIQDDVTMKYPTVDLAVRLCFPRENNHKPMEYYLELKHTLFKYFFEDQKESRTSSLLSTPLQINKRILSFILGATSDLEELEDFIHVYYPDDSIQELVVGQEIQSRLSSMIETKEKVGNKGLFCFLWGPNGVGKKFQMKHLSRREKQSVLFIDSQKLFSMDMNQFTKRMNEISREMILQESFVCFYRLEIFLKDQNQYEWYMEKLFKIMDNQGSTVFLLSESPWRNKERITAYDWIDIELKVPDRMQSSLLWKNLSRDYIWDPKVNFEELSNKFQFTPGQIRQALLEAERQRKWNHLEYIDEKSVHEACYTQMVHHLEEKAARIEPIYQWEDLILPMDQKQHLKNACNHIKYKHIVYDRWGFDKKLSYGKGLSILFSGPPGTGKTMAAQVIASELKLEMYKVDLSQMVSKYVGETEKNLSKVFEEAGKCNCILFFDETDALFGKRSEVKDSHDKYANIQTSFLLQKMEEYQGVAVMTTNYLQNIDHAFLRRINYIIHFPFPDAQQRQQIWESMFPRETPLSEKIDFRYLADQFELSGGHIKNIALSAAFLAADHDEKVMMKHIITAVKVEMDKLGKVLLKEDFGEYGFYL